MTAEVTETITQPRTAGARVGLTRSAARRWAWLECRRADAAGVTALLALTTLVSWDRLRHDDWVARVDLLTFYLPWYAHLGQHLRHLDVPGWNPHQFSGTPFAGDPQSGWMYLPAMLAFTLLPAVAAMKAFMVIHLVVGGLATYALARVLGVGAVAGVIAGAVFEFGPFLFHDTRCCTIEAQIAPWVPLSLLGVDLALRARSGTARALWWWLAGFGISQMMAGWVGQGAYNGLLIVGTYLAYRTLIAPPAGQPKRRHRLQAFVANGAPIGALGFALSAAGILVRLDVNRSTNLAGGDYELVNAGHNGAWDLVGLLDRILSDDRGTLKFYMGGAALALAVLAPLLARRRAAVPYFTVFSVAVLTMTLHPTPLHRLLYLLPRYKALHEHSAYRIMGVLWVGPAILAAATVEALPAWARRRWAVAVAAIPPLALILVVGALRRHGKSINGDTIVAVVAVSLLVAAGCILANPTFRARTPRLARLYGVVPILLLGLVFWDPTGRGLVQTVRQPALGGMMQTAIDVNAGATDPGGAGAFLQERMRREGPFRYFGYDAQGLRTAGDAGRIYHRGRLEPNIQALLVSARAMRLGLNDIQGYNPVQLSRYVEFLQAVNGVALDYHDADILPTGLRSPLLNLLNDRYIVIPATVPAGQSRPDLDSIATFTHEVFRNDRIRVMENDGALPHAWIVHDARRVKPGQALPVLSAGLVDPRHTALLETDPPALAQPANAANDAATITSYEADTIRLTTQSEAPGVLMLSEIYASGWYAYVDGRRVPVDVADHILRAVPLPAGAHTVELRYEPWSLRLGVPITLAAFATLPILLALLARRQVAARNSPAHQPVP